MGCLQSRSHANAVEPISSEPNVNQNQAVELISPMKIRIIEDCIVVWLVLDKSVNIQNAASKLRHIISTVIVFFDQDECLNYVQSIRIEKVFLIVPSIDFYVDNLRKLPQIEKVYAFIPQSQEDENRVEPMIINDTNSDINNLCKQLEIDVELCELDLIPITTTCPPEESESTIDCRKREAAFLLSQLMSEILYRLKFENNAKAEFINFCRAQYVDNEVQMSMIDNFEANYRPQKVIHWITKQCFIWRILQRMQRTLEIDILYKLGFLLKHAHTQLNIVQEKTMMNSENRLVVYRGKTMFKEKFNHLVRRNTGGLLCFGNFFAAHFDRELSMDFIGSRLNALPETIGILFEIHIDPTIRNARSPFAPLEKIQSDEYHGKPGIFFGMHSVFRIDYVDQFIDEVMNLVWIVKLTLVADDDQQLLRLVAPLRSSEVHANPISYVGKLFMDMGDFERAEEYFLSLLQDSSVLSQPRRLVRVHIGLGANYMITGEYDKALEQYEQALQVSLTYLPPTHTDLAPLYDAIGKNQFQRGNYQKAVENYEKAADLIGNKIQTGCDSLVNDLNTRIDGVKTLLNNGK